MHVGLPNLVAFLAPTVNCIQLFPQLVKTYQTKKVKDISYGSLALIILTNILWLMHGYFIQDIPLIASGSIAFLINFSLLILYIKFRK